MTVVVMKSSSQGASSQFGTVSKVEEILTAIRNISKGENKDTVVIESEDTIFCYACNIIKLLTADEFGDLEEKLLLYLTQEWKDSTNCCFATLEFIADIFSYICSIANLDIVQQYLYYFSQPSVPHHIRLVIYPAILTIANQRFPTRPFADDNFMDSFEECILKLSQEPASLEEVSTSAKEFVHFWNYRLKYDTTQNSKEVHHQLLTTFLASRVYFEKLCVVNEYRIKMFKILAHCLTEKLKEETGIILSSLFVIFLQSLKFTQNTWPGMAIFIERLHFTASHHSNPIVQEFVSMVINSFLNCVQVPSENLINELKAELVPSPTKTVVSSKDIQQSQTHENQQRPLPTTQNASHMNGSGKQPEKKVNGVPPPGPAFNSNSDSTKKVTGPPQSRSQKTVELLEQLVTRMKDSNMKLEESDQQRLEKVINDLTLFL